MLRRRLYPAIDLVVHEVLGVLEEDELIEAGTALYTMDSPPRFSLWHIHDPAALRMNLERMRAVQANLAGLVRGRSGGKTAIVAATDLSFGLARQYASLAESHDLPFEHHVFRSLEDALDWLGIDAALLEESDDGETEH